MAAAPSFQDLIAVGQNEAQARRATLTFREGDITVAQNHGAGAMADLLIQYAAQLFRDTFFDGAEGDALDEIIEDRTQLKRKGATAAEVQLRFNRVSSGAGGSIPAGTAVATAHDAGGNQIVFTTDAPVVVGAGLNGPFLVDATATEIGTAGNVEPNKVTQIQSALFDTFTCTNDAAAGGGNETESDEEYRRRGRAYFTTLVRGTRSALEQGALQVSSVRIARATEDPVSFAVQVLVGDQDGNSTLQMVSDVVNELEDWRCAGVNVTVVGSSRALVSITIALVEVSDGFDTVAAAPLAVKAVETYLNKRRTGETGFLDAIRAAAISVAPDDIFDVDITAITVNGNAQDVRLDIIPTSSQVLRPDTITVA